MDDSTAVADKLAIVAQAVIDAIEGDTDGLSPSAVAALISLKARGILSIGTVAQLTGLTHSAAVRLVDRLEKDWLVRRQRRAGREVMVELTSRGRRRAGQLQEKRLAVTGSFLGHLSAADASALDAILSRLIAGLVAGSADPDLLFRMSALRAHTLADGELAEAGE
ncbi:MarR family transcriptional regulator [Methylobrevis pamukkalensis]|uniref:MarR family protein n=1 Tax=Methylobrevis pamukkalensis TaxID=1439726 RepID=A0A1E3H2E2_9HYPH|nr:MarR family transcriptional regulator [Methylobrevis pamukkalensis]ODN70493.1 MarR family protein [Methylobrevis pamukkalensis]